MNLLCRKGRCPYEWVDGIEMLDADGIPPPEAFRLQLNMIASYTIMMMMLINTKTHQAVQRHDLLQPVHIKNTFLLLAQDEGLRFI